MNICWITIYVRDMAESLKFYTQTLGLQVKRSFSAGGGTEICFLDGKGTDLELIFDPNRKEVSCAADVSVGFQVESLDKTMADLKEKGITQLTGPIAPNPSIRFTFVTDPNGLKIQLAEQN